MRHRPAQPARGDAQAAWSGKVVFADGFPPKRPLVEVFGAWTVPKVARPPGGPFTNSNPIWMSATWVGLDGAGNSESTDVFQAGTEQDLINFPLLGLRDHYYAWFEWFPKTGIELSNLEISPGMAVFVQLFIVDPAGHFAAPDLPPLGQMFFVNLTTQAYYSLFTIGETFHGNSAEWIVETPSYQGDYTPLPDFTQVAFFGAAAIDTAGTVFLAADGTSQTLDNTGAGPGRVGSDDHSAVNVSEVTSTPVVGIEAVNGG